jgi:hypothetical protein
LKGHDSIHALIVVVVVVAVVAVVVVAVLGLVGRSDSSGIGIVVLGALVLPVGFEPTVYRL